MSTNGDWYCLGCGYLSASRVTNSETCDTCHQPVEWHDADQQGRIEELAQQLTAAQAECMRLREKLENVASAIEEAGWIHGVSVARQIRAALATGGDK